MTASPQPQPGPDEEAVFRCLESEDPDRELLALADRDPELAQRARTLLDRLDRQGLLADAGAARDVPEIMGRYRLLRRLGQGGMGIVHEARDRELDTRVAVKLIRPDMLPFAKSRQRFDNEIEALAKLHHPGIVEVLGAGEENGLRYYAMEFVAGESLQQILWRLRGRQPGELHGRDLFAGKLEPIDAESTERSALLSASWPDACVRLVRDVAQALAHAHERGILHRDVKPGNVMLDHDGRVRVLDFGLARRDDQQTMTRTGAAIGSLPYMAPEQVRGDRDAVDERTDVYALGVVLFELLALHQPFLVDDNPERTRDNVLRGRAPSLRNVNPDVGAELVQVCRRAMAQKPTARHATAAQFAGDLDAVLAGRPLATGSALGRFVQRHPLRIAGMAALAVLAALALGVQLVSVRAAREQLAENNLSLRKTAAAAVSEVDRAQLDGYRMRLNNVKTELAAGNIANAGYLLHDVPEHLRAWEWFHFRQRTRSDARIWRLPDASGVWNIGAGSERYAFLSLGNHVMFADPDTGATVDRKSLGGTEIQTAANRLVSANARTMVVLSKTDDRHIQLGDLDQDLIVPVTLDRGARRIRPSPDGSLVWVGCKDGTSLVLDGFSGNELFRIPPSGSQLVAATFSHDNGLLCVGLADERLQMWNVPERLLLWEKENTVLALWLAFAPDGSQLHALRAHDVLYTYRTGDGLRLRKRSMDRRILQPGSVQPQECQGFVCDPDGVHLWTHHSDAVLRCLHLPTNQWVAAVPAFPLKAGQPTRVTSMAVDPQRSRLLVSSLLKTVYDYDLRQVKASWLMPVGAPCRVAPTQNTRGDLFVGVDAGPPTLRRAGQDPVVVAELPPCNDCLFVDDTRVALAQRDAGEVLIYDIDTNEIVATLRGHTSATRSLAMLRDGRLASGDVSGLMRIWDLERGACVQLLEGHSDSVVDLAGLPDGRLASASWDGSVRLWDLAAGTCVWQHQLTTEKACAVAASPDGRWLAMGGEVDGASIVDLATGDVLPDRMRNIMVYGLAFTADGKRLVVTSHESGYVMLFDVPSWREVVALHPWHGAKVRCAKFASDGTTLLTVDKSGLVRIWPRN